MGPIVPVNTNAAEDSTKYFQLYVDVSSERIPSPDALTK